MAKLTGDMIKAGLTVWIEGRKFGKPAPVEVCVVTGIVYDQGKYLHVALTQPFTEYHTNDHDKDDSKLCIYLSDSGVRPYNYDSRPTQVFTTREELEEAMQVWGDDNPNFLEGE